jgi:hypothetical protein
MQMQRAVSGSVKALGKRCCNLFGVVTQQHCRITPAALLSPVLNTASATSTKQAVLVSLSMRTTRHEQHISKQRRRQTLGSAQALLMLLASASTSSDSAISFSCSFQRQQLGQNESV